MKRDYIKDVSRKYLNILEGIHYIASNCEMYSLLYGEVLPELKEELEANGFKVRKERTENIDESCIRSIVRKQNEVEYVYVVSWENVQEESQAMDIYDIAVFNQCKMLKNLKRLGFNGREYNCILGREARDLAGSMGQRVEQVQISPNYIVRIKISEQ